MAATPRATRTRSLPDAASCRAKDTPRPDDAPVTRARLTTSSRQPEMGGDAHPVLRRRAEEGGLHLLALHVQVHVVLPGVPDAAQALDALLGHELLAVARRRLGHRHR